MSRWAVQTYTERMSTLVSTGRQRTIQILSPLLSPTFPNRHGIIAAQIHRYSPRCRQTEATRRIQRPKHFATIVHGIPSFSTRPVAQAAPAIVRLRLEAPPLFV